jgi:tetratricopeptide (TPR) repeat protein
MRIAPLVLLLVADVAFAQAPERKELPKARAAQTPADKSREGKVWKGQEVVSKLGAIRMKRVVKVDDDGTPIYETIDGQQMSYLVRDEQGDLLLLRKFDGAEGWVEKDAVVTVKDSVAYFTKAIENDPDSIALNYRLRAAARKLNADTDGAIRDITEAMRLDPDVPELFHHRAIFWIEKKDFAKALADLETGLSRKPGYRPMLLSRALVHSKTAAYAESAKDYEAILKADDRDVETLNNLAWLLSTCPDENVRNGRRAVTLAEKVAELTERKNGSYLDTLAAAYAETRRFDDAVRVEQEALRDREFVLLGGNDANDRLELYRQKKAYREK